MTINYKGCGNDFDNRLAEISYDDETEQTLFDKIFQVMTKVKGWELEEVTPGYAACVVADRYEYGLLVNDYKECKKSAKLWLKFGF